MQLLKVKINSDIYNVWWFEKIRWSLRWGIPSIWTASDWLLESLLLWETLSSSGTWSEEGAGDEERVISSYLWKLRSHYISTTALLIKFVTLLRLVAALDNPLLKDDNSCWFEVRNQTELRTTELYPVWTQGLLLSRMSETSFHFPLS